MMDKRTLDMGRDVHQVTAKEVTAKEVPAKRVQSAPAADQVGGPVVPDSTSISFTVNGVTTTVNVPPARRLIDLLRNDLGLTGAKLACGIGRCGACTVLLDGRSVNACLVMAYQIESRDIVTIEGLSVDESAHGGQELGGGSSTEGVSADEPEKRNLHPLQEAFLEAGGFQCGYCTPGMILAAKALLDVCPSPTSSDIVEALSGNLCRCTGYSGIIRAVQLAAKKMVRNEQCGHAHIKSAINLEGEDVHDSL